MLTLLKDFIYQLIVRSRLLYHFLWIVGPAHLWQMATFHNGDKITDDAGVTMNVTKWNGRAMASFGPRMYSKIKDFHIRKDDVLLCGYPKTGCHWMQEIIHMLLTKKAEVSKYGKIFQGMIEAMPEIVLESVPSPRVLNTHVFYHELPDGARENKNKIILTVRCPKDVVVSFFNHAKAMDWFYRYEGTFENYFKMFVRGQVDFGSYFDQYISWSEVMTSQTDNQIYLVSYEELKDNPVPKIMDIADFLGCPVKREFAEEVAKVSSFSKLKDKRQNHPLFRKGIVGDWRNWLTDEQSDEMDRLWREKMAGIKLPAVMKGYCGSLGNEVKDI